MNLFRNSILVIFVLFALLLLLAQPVFAAPPSVNINSPVTGETCINDPVLEFTVSEGTYSVLLNGSPIAKDSGNNLGPLFKGTYTLRVEASSGGENGADEVVFTIMPGDIHKDGTIDLKDTIRALQVVSGEVISANSYAALQPDGKIRVADAINILRKIAKIEVALLKQKKSFQYDAAGRISRIVITME